MFFSEKCSHCKYELNVLNENAEKLKGVNFYLITLDKDIFTNGFTKKYPALKKAKSLTDIKKIQSINESILKSNY